MSKIPPPGSKIPSARSRLVPPGASRLPAPGSRLALPRAGGINVTVTPDADVNLPGAQFDVTPTRADVVVAQRPGVRTDKLSQVRQFRAPGASLQMAVAAGKEASAEATRLSTVGASSLVAPDFRGAYKELKVRYTGSDVAGELGLRREEESVPGLVVKRQQVHSGRTESSVGLGRGRGKALVRPAPRAGTGIARGAAIPTRAAALPAPAASAGSRLAAPRPGGSRAATVGEGAATTSRISVASGKSGSRAVAEDVSRGPVVPAGISKAALTRKIAPASAGSVEKQPEARASSRSARARAPGPRPSAARATGLKQPSKKKSTQESVIQKFDRQVNAEMKRRRDADNVLVEATTSDVNVLEAVDNLMRAEAMDRFAATVRAAEEAAASVPPELAEEAAVAAAKDYQTKLTHVMKHEVPGEKPIQVLGYIGVTKPKRPVR